LTGAGFGGCTIHLLSPSALPRLTEALIPFTSQLHCIRPASPASVLAMS
jgi:galactokinase